MMLNASGIERHQLVVQFFVVGIIKTKRLQTRFKAPIDFRQE